MHLLIGGEDQRDQLFDWAERELAQGECLVEVRDLIGARRGFTTLPEHPDAELVARALPKLLRGRLLSHVSWYRVPQNALDAIETHTDAGVVTHTYDTMLRPVVRGRRLTRATRARA